MKNLIFKLLGLFDVRITRKSTFEKLSTNVSAVEDLEFLKSIDPKLRSQCIDNLASSKAQLRQDLFVLSELNFKENGFFVEFGATNGIDLSNTFLLEKNFGWTGILAEPAKRWHKKLHENREVNIETRCVWEASGDILKFNETESGELSTLDRFSNLDNHAEYRKNGDRYDVETISLEDLLDNLNAPEEIEYLSVDTEGSEFDILKAFNFTKYRFRIITCEHNYTDNREKVYDLLTTHGYVRKFEEHSKFDDWYVLAE